MNSSYKIVLLGAFALFIAVVGYVVFFSGKPNPEAIAGTQGDDTTQPGENGSNTAPPLRQPETPAPQPNDEPEPWREVTIGPVVRDPIIETPTTSETEDTAAEDDLLAEGPEVRVGPGSDLRVDPTIDDLLGDVNLGEGDPISGVDRDGPGTTDDTSSGRVSDPVTEEADPTPPPSDPEPTTPTTTARTYTVKAGDTFASIALSIYGQEKAWFAIAQANPSVDPKQLQVGQVIALPKLGDPARDTDEPVLPAPNGEQTYTVRPGDNLSRIAQKFYKDSEKWDLIYARNRKTIGPKPDNLKVGMKLVIPQSLD